MKSTQAMRERARELATPPRDDFDRAVLYILDDFDALRAAASTSTEGAGVKMPVLTVFDWAYYKDGEERYARTPERAKQLMDEGVKVTPVYTIDGYRDFLPILNPPASKVTTDEAEERE